MSEKNKVNDHQRNPFVALCDYASQNNWCYRIADTTCGHSAFRIAFAKIIHGQHPDDETFWPYGKENNKIQEIKNFPEFKLSKVAHKENQMKLVTIVTNATVFDIKRIAKFPDWLGYIGLVIYHCPDSESIGKLSDAYLPQFAELVIKDENLYKYFQDKYSKKELLAIKDLELIEKSLVSSYRNSDIKIQEQCSLIES